MTARFWTTRSWGSWLLWVLATTLGLGAAFLVSRWGPSFGIIALRTIVLNRIMGGLALGLIQSFVLRRHGLPVIPWAVATALGFLSADSVAEAVGTTFFDPGRSASGLLFSYPKVWLASVVSAAAGATLGLAQWLVLAKFPPSGWWVFANAAGFALGGALALPACQLASLMLNLLTRERDLILAFLVCPFMEVAVFGAAAGAVTGLVLTTAPKAPAQG